MPPSTDLDLAPERDSITGLLSRRAFSQQVNQVMRDGDPYAIALISIDNFDDTVQVTGFEAGDDLLLSVSRGLLEHMSAITTVARTGDHQFGVLTAGVADDNLTRWASPVITSVKLAVSAWATDQSNFSLDMVAPPSIRVGTALGSGPNVWEQAGLGLAVATDNVDGDDVVAYRIEDKRIREREKQIAKNNRVLDALNQQTILVANQRIDLVGRSRQSWSWFRLTAAISARGSSFDLLPSFEISPILGRQLEQSVLKTTPQILRDDDGPARVTVPVSRELLDSRSFNEALFPIIESSKIPPSRIVFEIEEAALRQSQQRGPELIKRLKQVGSAVAINNCSGSWDTWELCTNLPISYVTPNLELYDRFSEASAPAVRALTSMAATCDELDIEMIAPYSSRLVPASTLTEIGITYIEQAPAIGNPTRMTPPSDIGFSHP